MTMTGSDETSSLQGVHLYPQQTRKQSHPEASGGMLYVEVSHLCYDKMLRTLGMRDEYTGLKAEDL